MNGSNNSVGTNDRNTETTSGEFPPPIAKLLGFRLVTAGDGQAVIELEADHRHSNPMGTLHGGVLCDIADAAMGFAYSTTLAPGETFTTVDLHINFLRPVWHAKLRAEAGLVRAGKVVGLIECNIFDEQRRLVARASSTCMKLTGGNREGRSLPVDWPRHLEEGPIAWNAAPLRSAGCCCANDGTSCRSSRQTASRLSGSTGAC